MTSDDFFRELSRSQPGSMTLSPGPFRVEIGLNDALAARLILWLVKQLPADATQGDVEEILDSAKWWSVFWDSQWKAHQADA